MSWSNTEGILAEVNFYLGFEPWVDTGFILEWENITAKAQIGENKYREGKEQQYCGFVGTSAWLAFIEKGQSSESG